MDEKGNIILIKKLTDIRIEYTLSLVAYKYGIAIAECLLGKTKLREHTVKKKSLF